MKINVKILRGEECTLDVQPDLPVPEFKKLVEESLNVPSNQQKLLLTGKPLLDSKKLSDYDLMEGSKINLIVGGKDGSPQSSNSSNKDILKHEMSRFLLQYYNESDSKKILDEFMKEFYRTTTACNLDDWERIAAGYLQEEKKHA